MRYEAPLQEAVFVARRKRFFCDVLLDGEPLTAHLANTGSMRGCTAPEAPVRVRDSGNPKRKLRYSAEQIRVDGEWIVVNTARANQVVREALEAGLVEGLAPYEEVAREVAAGGSRIDFRLSGPEGVTWLEVKSVTLREGRALRFPDAVTSRGARHAEELASLVRPGVRSVLFFLVPREGGEVVQLAADLDPTYARAVRSAVAAGVEVVAYRAVVGEAELVLGERLPVDLG